ncbi:hypothetical protein SAMN05444392_11931 [Seinonella peptonophila]|uniref:Uncharacterized protein n=1 Tax=Seinonella peptonophila TaxID=112248 RepID=A0A1M5B839_9BACL|nr:hypothetical protein SAMN05444392_11931 [Seinonella peptonophila]
MKYYQFELSVDIDYLKSVAGTMHLVLNLNFCGEEIYEDLYCVRHENDEFTWVFVEGCEEFEGSHWLIAQCSETNRDELNYYHLQRW